MTTHDYTNRGWGHDYCIMGIKDKGLELNVTGWGGGIENGDYLLLSNEGSTTRYAVKKVEYKFDPSDMWNATLTFAPR